MNEEHIRRVRRICLPLPETTEKLSHGEPTFFNDGRVSDEDLAVYLRQAWRLIAPKKLYQ